MTTIQQFSQYENNDGTYTFDLSDFNRIMSATKTNSKPKRPLSGYFLWLKKNRDDITSEYFDDFDSTSDEDWTQEKYESYYSSKGLNLPVDKKTKKITIKLGNKPKLVSLVTAKAGKIWKTMNADEKEPFMTESDELQSKYKAEKKVFDSNIDTNTSNEQPKKRGRGRPKKVKDNETTNDSIVNSYDSSGDTSNGDNCDNGDNCEDNDSDSVEMDVEEYEHDGKTYYINPNTGDIYDPENEDTTVIAKVVDGVFTFL